jgi:hypothetical protein
MILELPVSGHQLEALEELRQLHRAHARAWLRIVLGFPEKGAQQLPRQQRQLQGTARVHALRALTDVLLSSIRYYRDVPRGLWSDIHRAYWHGVYPDAAGKPRHAEEIEAEAAYARALLLGLCGAGQLPYRAIDQVAANLGREWKLEPPMIRPPRDAGASAGRRAGQFLIDPLSDKPATPFLPGIRPRPSDQILETSALIRQLRARFQNLVKDLSRPVERGRLPPDFGELELLRSLMSRWSGGALRRQPRSASRSATMILGGLRRIYRSFTAHVNDQGPPEIVLSAADAPLATFGNSVPFPPSEQWVQIALEDHSEEGKRIRVRRNTDSSLTVGDLVCVGHPERLEGADIGVIVRARVLAADEVEFGIRRLGTGKTPARIHLVRDDPSPGAVEPLGTPFCALVLERAPAGAELIVADKGVYRPGATLCLVAGEDTRVVRGGVLLLSTRNFDAFDYTSTAVSVSGQGLVAKPMPRSPGTGGDQDAII